MHKGTRKKKVCVCGEKKKNTDKGKGECSGLPVNKMHGPVHASVCPYRYSFICVYPWELVVLCPSPFASLLAPPLLAGSTNEKHEMQGVLLCVYMYGCKK